MKENRNDTQLERGLNAIQSILLFFMMTFLVVGVVITFTSCSAKTVNEAQSVEESIKPGELATVYVEPAQETEIEETAIELTDREVRIAKAEDEGTDYNGFMKVLSKVAPIYDEKNGSVIGELCQGDYVYVHLVYADGYVFSGELQGYLKSSDLVELGFEIKTEESESSQSTLIDKKNVESPTALSAGTTAVVPDYSGLTTYRLEMPTAGISVDCVYTSGNQDGVDTYDVVHSTGVTSCIRLLGHNNRTMKSLHNVQVGDEFTYNGVTYVVVFSGTGVVNDAWDNVISDATGELLLYNHAVELITCHNTYLNKGNRWVVLADVK